MKKLNNKGFSLVELIIVIAIMAILIGVVGTQVIPYLEKSRVSKDLQVLSGWNTAAVSAYSTEAGNIDSSATYTIELSSGGITVGPASTKGVDKIKASFLEFAGLADAAPDFGDLMASKPGQKLASAGKVTITINGTTGEVKTEATGFDTIYNK